MMKSWKPSALAAIALMTGGAHAALIEVPPEAFVDGKASGRLSLSGNPASSPDADTVRIGPLTVRFRFESDVLPAVCGAKPTTVVQFEGATVNAFQTADTSSDWNGFPNYPASGLVPLDTISGFGSPDAASEAGARARGFPLVEIGKGPDCARDEFFFKPRWNRVVFLRFGSGVDYRAKLSFQAFTDTVVNPTPSIRDHRLTGLSLYYVVNRITTDLSGGPVAVRPARPERAGSRFGARVTHDLYNPLGVKLRRDAGRFEPSIGAPKAR